MSAPGSEPGALCGIYKSMLRFDVPVLFRLANYKTEHPPKL